MPHYAVWFFVLSLASLASASRAEPIVIFADHDYHPVIYLDTEHQPAGLLAEVMAPTRPSYLAFAAIRLKRLTSTRSPIEWPSLSNRVR